MYELNDTIVAVSSPTSAKRVIIRITGPATIDKLRQIFNQPIAEGRPGIISGSIMVDTALRIDAQLYLFLAPHSYTGETSAEIHIYTNQAVTEVLMGNLLAAGLRMAGPGEFTARRFLNGKIDLTQAEAVNEIIVSSNRFQLAAAEKLLSGRLTEAAAQIREKLIDCLSLIEAGLDFSGEDIEFISRDKAIQRLNEINNQLQQLLSGSIRYESMIDLPAVGIAGAPNAGKSSLLNRLLGKPRSIVSYRRKTTRDVLTALLKLGHCSCVLFDCAGLTPEPDNILDKLAQQAAAETLQNSSVVIFCVDISKTDWAEDVSIYQMIEPQVSIAVATKADLLEEDVLANRLGQLNELFDADFSATSAKADNGIELLKETIDKRIIELSFGPKTDKSTALLASAHWQNASALTARHKRAVTEAIENTDEAINQLKTGNDEVAAMMLRSGHQAISNIEAEAIDKQILEKIFHRFCIGK